MAEVLLFVCLSATIDAPMKDFQLSVIEVIKSEVLLFVCLSARIDTPMGDSNWV